MKSIIFAVFWVAIGASCAHSALAEEGHIDSDGKRYTVVEIDDEMLVTNEWAPIFESGYTMDADDRIKAIKESLNGL